MSEKKKGFQFPPVMEVFELQNSETDEFTKLFSKKYFQHERMKICLSTDKEIYHPGEIVHVTGVLLDAFTTKPFGEYDITEERNIHFGEFVLEVKSGEKKIYSENIGKIHLHSVGVVETTWRIPEELPGGEHSIELYIKNGKGIPRSVRKIDIYESVNDSAAFKKTINFLRRGYCAGELVKATLTVLRNDNSFCDPENTSVEIICRVDQKIIHTEKSRLNDDENKGRLEISFQLPEKISMEAHGNLTCIISESSTESITKTLPLLTRKLNCKIFPESGKCYYSVENGVYFQAYTPTLDPAEFKGHLIKVGKASHDDDDEEKELTTILQQVETKHEGRGYFRFQPEEGNKYFLKVDEPKGITERIPIPIEPKGTDGVSMIYLGENYRSSDNMVLLNNKKSTLFSISLTTPESKVKVDVNIYKREKIIGSEKRIELDPKIRKIVNIKNDNNDFRGVLRITVYESETGVPIAERLVFRRPKYNLSFDVKTDKSQYSPGENVELTIRPFKNDDVENDCIHMVVSVTNDTSLQRTEKRRRHPRIPSMYFLEHEVQELYDCQSYWEDNNNDDVINDDDDDEIIITTTTTQDERTDLLIGVQGFRRFLYYKIARKDRGKVENEEEEEEEGELDFEDKDDFQKKGLLLEKHKMILIVHNDERKMGWKNDKAKNLVDNVISKRGSRLRPVQKLQPLHQPMKILKNKKKKEESFHHHQEQSSDHPTTKNEKEKILDLIRARTGPPKSYAQTKREEDQLPPDDQTSILRDGLLSHVNKSAFKNPTLPYFDGNDSDDDEEEEELITPKSPIRPKIVKKVQKVMLTRNKYTFIGRPKVRRKKGFFTNRQYSGSFERKKREEVTLFSRECNTSRVIQTKRSKRGGIDESMYYIQTIFCDSIVSKPIGDDDDDDESQNNVNNSAVCINNNNTYEKKIRFRIPDTKNNHSASYRITIDGFSNSGVLGYSNKSILSTAKSFFISDFRKSVPRTMYLGDNVIAPVILNNNSSSDILNSVNLSIKCFMTSKSSPFTLKFMGPTKMEYKNVMPKSKQIWNIEFTACKEQEIIKPNQRTTDVGSSSSSSSEVCVILEVSYLHQNGKSSKEEFSKFINIRPCGYPRTIDFSGQVRTYNYNLIQSGDVDDDDDEGKEEEEINNKNVMCDPSKFSVKRIVRIPGEAKHLRTFIRILPSNIQMMFNSVILMMRSVSGCFEQCSSKYLPNLEILRLLKYSTTTYDNNIVMGKNELIGRLNTLIRDGYQKLASFEKVNGGGFSFFGRSKSKPCLHLSALGLMEFCETMKLMGPGLVDPKLIKRTKEFVLNRLKSVLHDKGEEYIQNRNRHVHYTYVLFCISHCEMDECGPRLNETVRTLLNLLKKTANKKLEDSETSPYFLSLLILTLFNFGEVEESRMFLRRMISKFFDFSSSYEKGNNKSSSTTILKNEKEVVNNTLTVYGSYGRMKLSETYALSLLAMLSAFPDYIGKAGETMEFLIQNFFKNGTFGTTQGTFLSLRAIAGFCRKMGGAGMENTSKDVNIGVYVNNNMLFAVDSKKKSGNIPDISEYLHKGEDNEIEIRVLDDNGEMPKTSIQFHSEIKYFIKNPIKEEEKEHERLEYTIERVIDGGEDEGEEEEEEENISKKKLKVGEICEFKVHLKNKCAESTDLGMIIVVIPIPVGLEVRFERLKELKRMGEIDHFEVFSGFKKYGENNNNNMARKNYEIVLYFEKLKMGGEIDLVLEMIAIRKGKYNSIASMAKLYYDSEEIYRKGISVDIY